MRTIDADVLYEDLEEYLHDEDEVRSNEMNRGYNNGIKCAMRRVKLHAPTLDVVPVVHARWKQVPLNVGCLVFMCSKCGTHSHFKTNYCSDCGARMDKEKTGD